ncbi:zinc finger protein 251-like [Sycon ciliatum]|uniref:zinc finger protein 251-like n=1 Tax=Sycon ciliatum TaxID=27933 RepID=UPI0031F62DF3
MEDFEESKSDCSVESNKLPPVRTMMKSKINVRDQSSRRHGPLSAPASSGSNIGEADTKKASCMRSASLENREGTSIIPREYTSSIFPVSPPPLMRWTRTTILSDSISNRPPAFKNTFPTARKIENDEVTTGMPPELEDVETSAFSAYDARVSTMKSSPQIEKDSLTPATASNTGVSVGRLRETLEQPDACDIPVGSTRPIRQNSDSSKVVAKTQDQCKRSKCKTSQICQFYPKEFKNVSQLRRLERDHTGDRPFKCDVCEKSFTLSRNLCAHKRTHTGRKQHKCKTSSLRSTALRRHTLIHSGERPFTCKTCGRSFTQSSHLREHERIHTGERPYRCRECPKFFRRSSSVRRHERIHNLQ